jgi:hypothetical protein
VGKPDPAGDAELAEHLAQVVLDGAGADEQPGGDLAVGRSAVAAKASAIGSECRNGGSVNSKRGSTPRSTPVQAS